MFCPECGVEYRLGFSTCSDCEAELVAEQPAPPNEAVRDIDLVEVLKVENLVALGLAESILEEAGIHYLVSGQRLYAAGFPVNRPLWIKVDRSDEEEARQLLANLME